MDPLASLAQMADIVPPEAPTWWPMIMLITIGLLFICGGFIWKFRKSQPTTISPQNQLKRIQKQWQTGELDNRLTAYWLASILRHHWQLPNLPTTPPSMLTINEQEWCKTVKQLDRLRYKNNSHQKITPDLFKTIEQWLQSNEIERINI
ncbi:MAG: hypothetical protein L3J70_03835 [Gammaproteobacteria bacterium]|nr:hypothetical protein [Gammaproteobacteria bacterium]